MFESFYDSEAQQYAYYSIPQLLFIDDKFKKLSCESKLLYAFLLDRAALSKKNGWIDQDGRVFVYFKLDELCEKLNIGKDKAIKVFNELDSEKGIGLICRKKQGQGKPTKIYVNNFTKFKGKHLDFDIGESLTSENPKSEEIKSKIEAKTSENPKSNGLKIRTLNYGKSEVSLYNHPYRTNLIESSLSINQDNAKQTDVTTECIKDRIDMDSYTKNKELIYSRIDYEDLIAQNADEQNKIDEIVENMLEMLCCTAPVIKISGKDISTKIVHSRLAKIDSSHIEYILICLKRNTTKVRNIKAYLRAVIYNAPSTMDSFYGAEVNNALSSPKLE